MKTPLLLAAVLSLSAPCAFAAPAPAPAAAQPEILTPPPLPTPRINGPKVYGARPGNPFLYRVPCTGERPMAFSAEGLPAGLALDAATGIITGTTPEKGEYRVMLKAKNAKGASERVFKIVAGDTLSLTPQMGWNSWYTYFHRVTDKDMRRAADILVESGMADAGYQFVNVDDCWYKASKKSNWYGAGRFGKVRDDHGNIIPNDFFPDMKGMADYIHAKGLKAGIYLSPGTKTCTNAVGSLGHYEQDAKQLADWGYDFLKFDSYIGICDQKAPVPTLQKPFKEMGDILKAQKRDIVFNLCQYGWGDSWKWGKEVGGHSWRTAGDLGFELHRIHDIALKNAAIGEFTGPGGWNDPDYLQIGWVASQVGSNLGEPHPSKLTPAEQYSFMSLWCLLPAPLIYGGDLTHLDAFTLGILCNPEVIDVNQDPLGKPGRVIREGNSDTYLMVKDLEDGSKAVGLCNRGEREAQVTADWKALGVTGGQTVRDLWRMKDVGVFEGGYSAKVPAHGVVLVKVGAGK